MGFPRMVASIFIRNSSNTYFHYGHILMWFFPIVSMWLDSFINFVGKFFHKCCLKCHTCQCTQYITSLLDFFYNAPLKTVAMHSGYSSFCCWFFGHTKLYVVHIMFILIPSKYIVWYDEKKPNDITIKTI